MHWICLIEYLWVKLYSSFKKNEVINLGSLALWHSIQSKTLKHKNKTTTLFFKSVQRHEKCPYLSCGCCCCCVVCCRCCCCWVGLGFLRCGRSAMQPVCCHLCTSRMTVVRWHPSSVAIFVHDQPCWWRERARVRIPAEHTTRFRPFTQQTS